MWQLFSMCAVVSNTLEETIDKATMLNNAELDTFAAAWIRNGIVFAIAVVTAIAFNQSLPHLITSLPVVWWGLAYALQAISYTWILKHIEMTTASVTFALLPLWFLPIDIFIFPEKLTLWQVSGIFLLAAGALTFFARRNFSKLFTRRYVSTILGILVFDAIVFGSEGYIFKSYYEELAVTPIAFLVSGMFYMCVFLTGMLLIRWLWTRGTMNFSGALAYARGSTVAKVADYGHTLFTLQALTLASVSQVTAMKVFQPLILLCVLLVAQRHLKVELGEIFTRDTIIHKALGIILVVTGSFLIA